jgi:hypothetical protein
MNLQEYYKQIVFLPNKNKMILFFLIDENIKIKKAICHNEYIKKSFDLIDLSMFELNPDMLMIKSSEEEYLKYESYL